MKYKLSHAEWRKKNKNQLILMLSQGITLLYLTISSGGDLGSGSFKHVYNFLINVAGRKL